MVRPHIAVWRAAPSDSSTVADLWIASAMAGGMNPDLAARAAAGTRVAEALERPGVQVLVADLEGKPAGIAVVGTRFDGLLDAPNLAVDELFVMPEARRHGVGRQLMAAVARLAESEGYALVFAHVPSADKASNRLLARLGFGISVTLRVVPTAVLRRKLTVPDMGSRDVLLGRRRAVRARTAGSAADTGPIPTRPLALRRQAAG